MLVPWKAVWETEEVRDLKFTTSLSKVVISPDDGHIMSLFSVSFFTGRVDVLGVFNVKM